jgi:CubicO group peptidase (beta-lactamase class C family)
MESKSSMGKLFFYATVVSGVVAAYLMYRRGESLGSIAQQTITNPLGTLASEVKNAL